MANTPYMSLALPTVSQTLGPAWASQLVAALGLIDSHTHVSGQGQQVPSAGLNINADLSFGSFNATQLRTARFSDQVGTLGSAGDARCIYSSGGNLWWNSGAGTPVQLTSGGALAGTPGSISGLTSPAAVTYFSGTGTFAFTSASNVAATLDGGPVVIRQTTASAFGITLQSPPSLAAAYTATLWPALPAGQRIVTLDSTGALAATWNVDGATVQVASNLIGVIGATATGVNASATIKGNRSAADAGADVVSTGQATRTAGLLHDFQNFGASRVSVRFDGNIVAAAGLAIGLVSGLAAGSAATDFLLVASATRTAGLLLDLQTPAGTSKFSVGFDGTVKVAGLQQWTKQVLAADDSVLGTGPNTIFTFALAANTRYRVRGYAVMNSDTAGARLVFSLVGGVTFSESVTTVLPGLGNTAGGFSAGFPYTYTTSTLTSLGLAFFDMTILVTGTGGSLTIGHAASTSGSTSVLFAGAYAEISTF
jgi:hypothetical protein